MKEDRSAPKKRFVIGPFEGWEILIQLLDELGLPSGPFNERFDLGHYLYLIGRRAIYWFSAHTFPPVAAPTKDLQIVDLVATVIGMRFIVV